jgi:hypothetical protein
MISSVSPLFCTRPFHLKIDVTEGITLPQAASRFSTTDSAILLASRRLDVVINTTKTLRNDPFINRPPAFLSKSCALPRDINATDCEKTIG